MRYVSQGFQFKNGDAVPALLLSGARLTLTATDVSTVEAALPVRSALIIVRATENIWLRFGNTGMDAAAADDDSILFLSGCEAVEVPFSDASGINAHTHVRVIRAGENNSLVQIERVATG